MNSTTQSFACSLALHGACAAALIAFLATPIQQRTPSLAPRENFTIIPTFDQSSGNSTEVGSRSDAPAIVSMPKLPPTPATPAQQVLREVEPTPSTPVAQPTRQQSANPSAPKSERMSFDAFRNRYGGPSQSTKQLVATPNPGYSKINASDFAYRGSAASSSKPTADSGESSLSEEFTSELLAELRRSYTDREVAFAGLSTEVEFTVTENGRLKASRITESSGQTEFDKAVLAALQRVQLSKVPTRIIGRCFKTRFKVPSS